MRTSVALVVLMTLVPGWLAVAAEPVAVVTVENSGRAERPAGPVTFGMVFRKGDVPNTVVADAGPSQADVKRRWPDGSVKHAVLTVQMPAMAAGAKRRVGLLPVAVGKREPYPGGRGGAEKELKGLAPVEVAFAIHKGPTVTATLAEAMKDFESATGWLKGPLTGEYIVRAVPRDKAGKADPDLEVSFRVRHYPSAKSTRVAVVVENCKWTSPGGVPYDVAVTIGGKQVFAQARAGDWPPNRTRGGLVPRPYAGHPKGARWIKRFWIGRPLDDVLVRYDLGYLTATGLIPPYDTSVRIEEKELVRSAKNWANAETAILQRGTIMAYFPTTGGRADIGPLPAWTTRYLFSQDPRPRAVTFGNADLSGSCPVHLRDPKTGWLISLDEHPGYSHNSRGTRERVKPRDTSATPWIIDQPSHFSVDGAHQPSLTYVPYLLTGDHYYLEEMWFWANHNMISIHYAYREKAKGLLKANQTRGQAWTMRNLLHAAALSPDGSKEMKYFEAKLANNLAYYKSVATAPDASPLGLYGATFAYTRGWTQKEWAPKIPWRSRYYSMPPWQHGFLAWAFSHIADQGYADAAPFRDYLMRFSIGVVSHPDEISPHAGSAYYLFIGQRVKDKNVRWVESFKEMAELTYGAPRPEGVKALPSPTATGASYGSILRGVLICAARDKRPGALEAFRWIDSQFKNVDLTWRFTPPPEHN